MAVAVVVGVVAAVAAPALVRQLLWAEVAVERDSSVSSGRVIGLVLIVAGVIVGAITVVFLLSGVSSGGLTQSGAILGIGLAFVVLVAPLVGFGVVMLNQGAKDEQRRHAADLQRRLLDIVRSRGQVGVPELALEMQISQDEIKAIVHKLVGLQVFSGYVNWEKGVLYSDEAQQLRELQTCRNCGGEIQLTGKGVTACKYCGTEYFLS